MRFCDATFEEIYRNEGIGNFRNHPNGPWTTRFKQVAGFLLMSKKSATCFNLVVQGPLG